mmetsp:Transcript_19507/g.29215  ORF Transcript_19507/g.29215 Transcript_19507/m.29215 type:complete len:209 (+) Transcript_19507:721-1347(+)
MYRRNDPTDNCTAVSCPKDRKNLPVASYSTVPKYPQRCNNDQTNTLQSNHMYFSYPEEFLHHQVASSRTVNRCPQEHRNDYPQTFSPSFPHKISSVHMVQGNLSTYSRCEVVTNPPRQRRTAHSLQSCVLQFRRKQPSYFRTSWRHRQELRLSAVSTFSYPSRSDSFLSQTTSRPACPHREIAYFVALWCHLLGRKMRVHSECLDLSP